MKFMKKNSGFTLVELIVVIAILGILVGVAVPAYGGYVEKANEAVDQHNLAVLNSAFAAACSMNGEDHYGRSDVSITTSGGAGSMKVTGVSVGANANISTDFATYYGEGGEFKTATRLYYSASKGGFEINSDGLLNQTGYRKDYAGAADGYMNSGSSYLGNEQDLLNTVGTFSTVLADFLTNPTRMEKLLSDPSFAAFCTDNGIDTTNTNAVANAMALYAAQELSDVDSSAIHSALVSSYDPDNGGYKLGTMMEIMNSEDATPADMALDGAVLAAVIAGYANSEYASQDVKDYYAANQGTVNNATTLFNYLNGVIEAGITTDENGVKTDSFAQYLNSSQGVTDIDAFTNGLGAVQYGTSDLLAAETDEAFAELIGQLLSGTWSESDS